MRVTIVNEGEDTIHVVIDDNTIDDSRIEPEEEASLQSEAGRVIELQDLGGLQGDLSEGK